MNYRHCVRGAYTPFIRWVITFRTIDKLIYNQIKQSLPSDNDNGSTESFTLKVLSQRKMFWTQSLDSKIDNSSKLFSLNEIVDLAQKITESNEERTNRIKKQRKKFEWVKMVRTENGKKFCGQCNLTFSASIHYHLNECNSKLSIYGKREELIVTYCFFSYDKLSSANTFF